jgi:hypothetical protein
VGDLDNSGGAAVGVGALVAGIEVAAAIGLVAQADNRIVAIKITPIALLMSKWLFIFVFSSAIDEQSKA